MDGWSSNNDSYHFGVGYTSIMLRKRWSTPQCAMHADFNIAPWGTTYENIICSDCDVPHTTVTMSRAREKSVRLHFLHIKYVIRGLLLGKYQHQITARKSFILPLGSSMSLCWGSENNNNASNVISRGLFLSKTHETWCFQCTCTCYLHIDKSEGSTLILYIEYGNVWLQT